MFARRSNWRWLAAAMGGCSSSEARRTKNQINVDPRGSKMHVGCQTLGNVHRTTSELEMYF